MNITIHNVGHGLCVSLIHENGNTMLWDCGHSENNRPSKFLPSSEINKIDYFFVTNYDEDHVSDLPNLRSKLNIGILSRNPSISPTQLRQLKIQQSGEISVAMDSVINMMETYNGPIIDLPSFPGVDYKLFYNNYIQDFNDTNNISLVTILNCGGRGFIIPGDIEVDGWKHLLKNDEFRNELKKVSIFIASHHGRESGYCNEVFDICSPDVVIFSDSEIKHATQEMASTYGNHSRGIVFNGETRYVLSTRKDGSLSLLNSV